MEWPKKKTYADPLLDTFALQKEEMEIELCLSFKKKIELRLTKY